MTKSQESIHSLNKPLLSIFMKWCNMLADESAAHMMGMDTAVDKKQANAEMQMNFMACAMHLVCTAYVVLKLKLRTLHAIFKKFLRRNNERRKPILYAANAFAIPATTSKCEG